MVSRNQEFRTAYRAWKDAFDQYDDQIDEILAGDPSEFGRIQPIIENLETLRLKFMEKSKPFLRDVIVHD
ncbi:MAG: hypothetical protein JWP38_3686 [Herbaspirillum sp.]|nr:hypothetical protein [Herbaspirillum sp.]